MSLKYFIGAVAFVAFMCGVIPAIPAVAQAIDLSKINKIARYNTLSKADFEAKTKVFTEIPQGDMFLEYTVRLGTGWQRLGMEGEERKEVAAAALEKVTEKKPSSGAFDISNLRDQNLIEEKNSVNHFEGKDSEVAKINADVSMLSRRARKDPSLYVPAVGNSGLLGPVAKYVGPANIVAPARFEIFAMEMGHDITAKNWFLNYVLSNNYTLTGLEEIDEQRVDGEYVMIENAITYVVRTAAIFNGTRMILASYYLPEQFLAQAKETQQLSIDSFQFLNPELATIDNKRTHGFLDLVKFSYPETWKLIAPNVYAVDHMTAKLIYSVDTKTLDGQINIDLISTELDTNLMKEIEFVREDLKKRGFSIGGALEVNSKYSFDNKISFSRVEAYEISGDDNQFIDYEFWLAIMVEDRYYYIVTMMTPGRTASFYKWARNTETFGLVIESMMPQTAGETLDAAFFHKTKGTDSGGVIVIPTGNTPSEDKDAESNDSPKVDLGNK